MPFIIKPGETKTLQVCVRPLVADTAAKYDTLRLGFECFGQMLALKYKAEGFSDTSVTKCGLGLVLTHKSVGEDYFESVLYPNPAQSSYYIEYLAGSNATANIIISNLEGKIIKSEKYEILKGNYRIENDASDLENGYYILKLIVKDKAIIHKLIINK